MQFSYCICNLLFHFMRFPANRLHDGAGNRGAAIVSSLSAVIPRSPAIPTGSPSRIAASPPSTVGPSPSVTESPGNRGIESHVTAPPPSPSTSSSAVSCFTFCQNSCTASGTSTSSPTAAAQRRWKAPARLSAQGGSAYSYGRFCARLKARLEDSGNAGQHRSGSTMRRGSTACRTSRARCCHCAPCRA